MAIESKFHEERVLQLKDFKKKLFLNYFQTQLNSLISKQISDRQLRSQVNFIVEPFDQLSVNRSSRFESSNKSHSFNASLGNFSENRVVQFVAAVEEKILIGSESFRENFVASFFSSFFIQTLCMLEKQFNLGVLKL